MYTTYKVEVGDPITSKCRRRYSDFQWLYNRLHEERPGAIIPIIPHRQALQQSIRLSEELVAERRGYLEVFLRRVMVHPELKDASCLAAFLRADDTLFEAAKREGSLPTDSDIDVSDSDAASPKSGGAGSKIMNVIHKTKTKIAIRTGAEFEKTDDDPAFEELDEYVQNLDAQVKALSKHASSLVKGTGDNWRGLDELGQTFFSMGLGHQNKAEESFRSMLTKISDGLAAVVALGTEQENKETSTLDDPLKELEREVQAVKIAMKRRKEWHFTYTSWTHKIKARQGNLDKLRASPTPSDEKLNKAEADLHAAMSAADTAQKDLANVSKRVMREIERFKVWMHEKIRETIQNFVQVEIEYNKKMEDTWKNLAPYLEANPDRDSKDEKEPEIEQI